MDWDRRRLHVYRNEWGEYVFKIGDSRACLDSGEAEELAGEILDLSTLREQLEAQTRLADVTGKALREARADVVRLECAEAKRLHPYP